MGKHRALATVGIISSLAVLSFALVYFRQQRERRRQKSNFFLVSHRTTLQDKKPQESFGCVLADNSRTPFVHLRTEENGNGLSHPFGERIRKLLEHPPVDSPFMQPGYEEPPGMEVSCEWIETKEELHALVQALSDETEIAVDTEQHSFHSFRGFTGLVQISTKTTDYLVDSIALHDSMSILVPIFANPAICKVFHGADSDILWLQRDFHIYVVNMFDTAKACVLLGKQQRSLSSLLQLYCSVTTDKSFQRADWRLRPLPKDMLLYARTDAHYLLYIANRLCTELSQNTSDERMEESGAGVEGNYSERLLEQTVYRSNLNCLNLYEKDGASASPTSIATNLVSRYYNANGCLPPSQLHEKFSNLVTNLCEWRDSVARIEDESLGSILSDTALMALAVSGPPTLELICATIAASNTSPQVAVPAKAPHFSSLPPTVQKYMSDLLHIIQRSGAGPAGETLLQNMTPRISFEWLLEKMLSIFKLSGTAGEYDKDAFEDEFLVKTSQYKTSKRLRLGSTEKSRIQFVKKFSCKAPVYRNCRIYADDGRLLCFCDRKKLEWYVKRGLAVYMEEEPPSVRLLFEPKGRPEYKGNDFYIQSKSNRCVGCGESSHYLRYRIIPSCYRQHFPEHLKSHRSHDIVLLCVDCHEIAHKAAEKHKRQIALEYGIPLFAKVTGAEGMIGGQNKAVVSNESEGGVSPLQLKNAAMALLRHGSTIPTQRRAELEKVVQTYYGRDNISMSDLHSVLLVSMGPQDHGRVLKKGVNNGEGATAGPVETPNKNQLRNEYPSNQAVGTSISLQGGLHRRQHSRHKARRNESLWGHAVHGRRIVEILMEQEGDEEILKFCQRWRRVFVDAIQPTFLPLGWEIEHSGRREFGDFSIFKPSEDAQ
ncbi:unnamed protein product [Calypogeia fissa]